MKYKIARIKSRYIAKQRALLLSCILLFFLCFAISGYYSDSDLPKFIFEQHKKASVYTEAFYYLSSCFKGLCKLGLG